MRIWLAIVQKFWVKDVCKNVFVSFGEGKAAFGLALLLEHDGSCHLL